MDSPRRNILLIEDSASDARLIAEMLSCSRHVKFNLERVAHLSAGIERLRRGGIEAVLVDIKLPDSQGLDEFLQVQSSAPKVAIIAMSGSYNEKLAMQAVQQGAQDYLLKDYLNADELERTIHYAIERKRMRDALQKQTRIMESVLNSLADGVVVLDEEGHCLLTNPAAERIAGLSATNVAHHKWPEYYGMYHGDMTTPYVAEDLPLSRASRGEVVREEEVFIRNVRASEGVVVSVNATPLVDQAGRIRGSVAIFRDITLRRLAEEQIRQLKDALE